MACFRLAVLLMAFSVLAVDGADIHAAVRNDSPEEIEAALAAGEHIDKIGPGGQTPLMHGILQGMSKAVQKLLEKGADTTIGEKDGYTPLHGAGFQGRAKIARLLINHGLDPSEVHTDGYTPIHRACWGKEKRHANTVKAFLKGGVSPNEPAKNGKTPMELTSNPMTKEVLAEWINKIAKGEEM